MSRGASASSGEGRARHAGEGRSTGKVKRRRPPRSPPSELPPAERYEQAHTSALRLLSHRERSRAELSRRLRSKGYDVETVERVLDRLAETGLQSDERFAAAFASEAHRGRGLASSAVQGELRRRGVDRRLAAEAATERPEDEEERARALALSRASRMISSPPEVRRRRLTALLARRGYSPELCYRLAAEVAGADPDDHPR